jgi:hypothetical protein
MIIFISGDLVIRRSGDWKNRNCMITLVFLKHRGSWSLSVHWKPETGNRKLISMIILIAFKKQQAPSDKLQTAGGGKGWASGNGKPETRNWFP